MVAGEPAPSVNSSEQVQSKASSATAKKKKKSEFRAPTAEEVKKWATDWAIKKHKDIAAVCSVAEKARVYYDRLDWRDSRNKPIKAWKQKITAVWLTDEKINEARGIQPQRSYKQGGEADNYV